MVAVEVRDELLLVRLPDLHEALRDADLFGVPDDLLVLEGRERTVDFRMPAGLEDRHVLIHDGNVDVVAESVMEPREALAAVAPLPGKHQVPHDHAALHEAVLADDGRTRHAEHRFDRF